MLKYLPPNSYTACIMYRYTINLHETFIVIFIVTDKIHLVDFLEKIQQYR